jgi:uncharacterized membrane protein YfcA
MLEIFIGITIGFVMGLTGAGGALVAIPLFIHFLEMSLKEASLYSLMAVVFASLLNFYYQRKNVVIKIAFALIFSSAIGSFISHPYKKLIPDIGVKNILTFIAIYSLYTIWNPKKIKYENNEIYFSWGVSFIIGMILGVLTTFTGLGGGVLLLPVLLGVYSLREERAVATSLLVIGLSSLASFSIQMFQTESLKVESNFLLIAFGILVTSYALKIVLKRIPSNITSYSRKVVFTSVVILAVAKFFL